MCSTSTGNDADGGSVRARRIGGAAAGGGEAAGHVRCAVAGDPGEPFNGAGDATGCAVAAAGVYRKGLLNLL